MQNELILVILISGVIGALEARNSLLLSEKLSTSRLLMAHLLLLLHQNFHLLVLCRLLLEL